MSIFMDRHDLPGITAEDVAKAHKNDLEIQDRFNCRALTYWFDKERETAFCLFEAPEIQAVEALHEHSHGMVPGNIIEVEPTLVETFLGRISTPGASEYSGEEPAVVDEPAFRTILVTDLQDVAILKYRFGIEKFYQLIRNWKSLVEEIAQENGIKLLTKNEFTWVTAFPSASRAVHCALQIQSRTSEVILAPNEIERLHWSVSLSAGDPVTENDEMFGDTIQLAKCLCRAENDGQIVTSPLVKNLYKKEQLTDLSRHNDIKTLHPGDERFLYNLMEILDDIWDRNDLTNSDLTRELGLSESQFYRKISSLTGSTPTDFIKEFRLERAVQLIEKKSGNISQIAFETGFNNPSYFSKCFRERFGFLPSTYRKFVN